MKNKLTGKEMVRTWLLTKVGEKITEARLQIELYAFQQRLGKHYLPDSITRYCRDIRRLDLLGEYEMKEVPGRYKTWIVQRKPICEMRF